MLLKKKNTLNYSIGNIEISSDSDKENFDEKNTDEENSDEEKKYFFSIYENGK